MESSIFIGAAFVFGLIIGSFLNVVIHRLPSGESLNAPPSRCPGCEQRIRWYDNLPVLSWIILGGKCRSCRSAISIRYPLVELATGVAFVAAYLYAGATIPGLMLAAIISLVIALIFIDLDTQLLPNALTFPGFILGLFIGALEIGRFHSRLLLSTSLEDSIIGAAVGSGILILISLVYWLLRRTEGMGRGDIKMLAMIGAVSGWKAIVPVIFIASIFGAAFGISLGLSQRQGLRVALPFGPFLGLAFLAVIFFGPEIYDFLFL